MKRILVIGAGRSSSSLIRYLLTNAPRFDWSVTVGDVSIENARRKVGESSSGMAISFDINDTELTRQWVSQSDIVISLLPASFHPIVALRCLEYKKHFLTASYVSEELKGMHRDAESNGLLFLNECGLDPGIDHLSAMKVIDDIRNAGGTVTSFESFTGGLIAPQTDPENPWRYKFTWNPRNVVTAGQGTARYLHNGTNRYIPYQQIFKRVTPVFVPALGHYEGYANRDSLKYIEIYGLQGIATMLRGTLRNKGYCSAWNVLVQLGCCDDTYEMEEVSSMTHRQFLDAFLPPSSGSDTPEERVALSCGVSPNGEEVEKLRWSGFFDDTLIGLSSGTPARIVEHILNKKWKLAVGDKDQIVMWHRFRYAINGASKEIQASLVATGSDDVYTAMADTVGLPLAIAARLLATGNIKTRGVVIPVTQEFYRPILSELADFGIRLDELEIR